MHGDDVIDLRWSSSCTPCLCTVASAAAAGSYVIMVDSVGMDREKLVDRIVLHVAGSGVNQLWDRYVHNENHNENGAFRMGSL